MPSHRDQHPPEIVERDVLKQRTRKQGHRRNGHRRGRDRLGRPPASELTGHQAAQQQRDPLGQRAEKADARERWSEELQCQPRDERRHGRVSYVAPREAACIVERRQFVAVEPVLAVGESVQDYHSQPQHEQGQGRGSWQGGAAHRTRYLLVRMPASVSASNLSLRCVIRFFSSNVPSFTCFTTVLKCG